MVGALQRFSVRTAIIAGSGSLLLMIGPDELPQEKAA
jgi:hypothetical protein